MLKDLEIRDFEAMLTSESFGKSMNNFLGQSCSSSNSSTL